MPNVHGAPSFVSLHTHSALSHRFYTRTDLLALILVQGMDTAGQLPLVPAGGGRR